MEKLGFKPWSLGSRAHSHTTETDHLSHGTCTRLSVSHDFSGRRLEWPKYHSQAVVCYITSYSVKITKLWEIMRWPEMWDGVISKMVKQKWQVENTVKSMMSPVWRKHRYTHIYKPKRKISRTAYKKLAPRIAFEERTRYLDRGKMEDLLFTTNISPVFEFWTWSCITYWVETKSKKLCEENQWLAFQPNSWYGGQVE